MVFSCFKMPFMCACSQDKRIKIKMNFCTWITRNNINSSIEWIYLFKAIHATYSCSRLIICYAMSIVVTNYGHFNQIVDGILSMCVSLLYTLFVCLLISSYFNYPCLRNIHTKQTLNITVQKYTLLATEHRHKNSSTISITIYCQY